MGNIMAVVAVLLIHMERKAVTNMKPRNSLEPNRQTHCHSSFLPDLGCLFVPPTLASTDSQGRPHSDDEEHSKGNALVQVPVFHGNGYHQPPDKQYVGVLEVLYADLGRAGMYLRLWGLLLIALSLWGNSNDILINWHSLQTSEANGNGLWATADESQVPCSY